MKFRCLSNLVSDSILLLFVASKPPPFISGLGVENENRQPREVIVAYENWKEGGNRVGLLWTVMTCDPRWALVWCRHLRGPITPALFVYIPRDECVKWGCSRRVRTLDSTKNTIYSRNIYLYRYENLFWVNWIRGRVEISRIMKISLQDGTRWNETYRVGP